MERIGIAMQDGRTGAGAQHGDAGREANLILSCRRTSIWDPGGGLFGLIDPVGGVFLARLDEPDRRSRHLLDDPHRVRHEFAASAPPEAAADQHGLIPGDVLYIYTGWG